MGIKFRQKLAAFAAAIVIPVSLAVVGGASIAVVGDTVSTSTADAASCIRRGPTVAGIKTNNVCGKFYWAYDYGGSINSKNKLVCPGWNIVVRTMTLTEGSGKKYTEIKAKYCTKW